VDALATVVAALIGAALGSIGAVVVQSWMEQGRESERIKDALVERHLLALQEAVESLWYRLKNVADEGGAKVMKETDLTYWETTNVYALGRALAAERLVGLDGAFPRIKAAWPELGKALANHRIDRRVKDTFGDRLFHYEIVLLAEGVLLQSEDGAKIRLMMYTEFRREFNDESTGLRSSVRRGIEALESMSKEENKEIRATLLPLAIELSKVTGVPSTIPPPPKPPPAAEI
jgi:hypothetical protein